MNGRCRLVGAMLAVLLGEAVALGQDAAVPRKIYTRNADFRLPVQINEADRAGLAEVKLYVKAPPGEWACRDSAPPTQNGFSFRAPQDGEYWFSFVTVDKSGRLLPADPAMEPPGLIVVVDTQPPEVELRPLPTSSGQVFLQCRLIDANPDYRTVQADYELQGKWIALEVLADTPGVFQVPDSKILSGTIRVRAADMAGNMVTRDIALGPPKSTAAATPAADSTGQTAPQTAVPLPAPPQAITVEKAAPALLPASLLNPPPAGDILPVSANPPSSMMLNKEIPLVNARRCRLDYNVDSASGAVTGVEVWITSDQGKTWQMKGEGRDSRGPALVEFPGEGLFGYAFVVKSATSGSNPPSSGDAPDGWIEVDTIKPVAEFLNVALETGALTIGWVAHDKNLGREPVALYFASQATGPWQPIAGKLPSTGSYRWELPKNLPARVFIRLEAIDRAGNVTRNDTPGPVSLDPSRPRVTVLSVSPAGHD